MQKLPCTQLPLTAPLDEHVWNKMFPDEKGSGFVSGGCFAHAPHWVVAQTAAYCTAAVQMAKSLLGEIKLLFVAVLYIHCSRAFLVVHFSVEGCLHDLSLPTVNMNLLFVAYHT